MEPQIFWGHDFDLLGSRDVKRQNQTKWAAKTSEDHHRWLPLVINIIDFDLAG